MGILNRCRDARLEIIQILKVRNQNMDIHSCGDNLDLSLLNDEQKFLFRQTIKNRNLLKEALIELEKVNIDHHRIGHLLTTHHQILRYVLKVSTLKIDTMLDVALGAGALGGKINGSGGGDCMFAYAPENFEEVAEAI